MVEWGNCPDRFDSYFSSGDIVGSIPTFCTNRLDDSNLTPCHCANTINERATQMIHLLYLGK